MGIPFFLIIVVFLIILLNIFSSYAEQKDKKKIKQFLDSVNNTKIVSSQKLKEIKFIDINLENINLICKNELIMKKFDELKNYKELGMTNFGPNISNDQIKEIYGTNNFNQVLEYQNNYDSFLKTLVELSELLIGENMTKDAAMLLEIGITLDTDITKNYTLLADIYTNNNQRKKLFYLIDKVLNNNNISQEKIINYITNLSNKTKENV